MYKILFKLEKKVRNRIRKYKFKKYLLNIQKSRYEEIINLRNEYIPLIDNDNSCECILFSKDRAMQLHASLNSYYDNVINPVPIHLIYTCSSVSHFKSYQEIKNLFSGKEINFIKENNFREDVLNIIRNMISSKLFFLCDDGLFKEKFDMKDFTKFNPLIAVFSLWKGLDTTQRGTFQFQELPQFIEDIIVDENKKCWIWGNCINSPDWSYPLSVGGSLFSTKEMELLLNMIDFKAPNSLEGNLHKEYFDLFKKRYGICYNKSVLGHNPCNEVNSETINTINDSGYTAEFLLKKWEAGFRIKYEDLYGKSYNYVLTAKFEFVKRD